MRSDTPVEEVAAHLPAEIAELLMEHKPSVQRRALVCIRTYVCRMEARGAVLDPVNYQAVLYGIGLLALNHAECVSRLEDVRDALEEIIHA